MDEFKTQFQPALIRCDFLRVSGRYGRKHYVARFIQGKSRVIHVSRVKFKRAHVAFYYAHEVLARYRNMVQAALLAVVESQNVATD